MEILQKVNIDGLITLALFGLDKSIFRIMGVKSLRFNYLTKTTKSDNFVF